MNRKILNQENDAHKNIFTVVSDETKKYGGYTNVV
jgi:hypothetical protein